MYRTSVVILTLVIACTVLARDSRRELIVDLKFSPQEGVDSARPDLPPDIADKPVALILEDKRGGDPAKIGQGTNDDDETFPIRAASLVIPFVHDTAAHIATNWGVTINEDSDRVLTLRLSRYSVDESNKAVGSVYEADVRFAYVLSDHEGKKLAEGTASGSATRYGRARSKDNCNEVLSDALKDALATMFNNASLQDAWTKP